MADRMRSTESTCTKDVLKCRERLRRVNADQVSSFAVAGGLNPMRTRAKISFTYSVNISRAVALLAHQGSARRRSETTGNGSNATSGSWWAI